jgi:hypothetical protein
VDFDADHGVRKIYLIHRVDGDRERDWDFERRVPGGSERVSWGCGVMSPGEKAAKLRRGEMPWQQTFCEMQRNDLPNDAAEQWLRDRDKNYERDRSGWRGFLPVKARPYSTRGPGRPPKGLEGELGVRALTRMLPHYTLGELDVCLGMRRRSGRWLAMYEEFAVVVARLPLNHESVADELGWNKKRFDRLRARGTRS